MRARRPARRYRRPWDVPRLVARALCLLFGLVGALPLLGGVLLRSEPVRRWAAAETARVLERELGVTATYQVEVTLWPLAVSVHDLEVPSLDGGTPALSIRRVSVAPRVFALLAGRLDAGDIEIDAPSARLVVRDGALVNVAYRVPEQRAPARELEQAPFSSISVTDARLDLDVDGVRVVTGPTDIDVFADKGPSFEVALRSGATEVTRTRTVRVEASPNASEPKLETDAEGRRFERRRAVDEDVLCRLDLRARYARGEILVRRLSLQGEADRDPAPGTRPSCRAGAAGGEGEWHLAARLSELRFGKRAGEQPFVDGQVMARAPAGLVNRFVETSTVFGWVGVSGELRYDGTTKLPKFKGTVQGGSLGLDVYHLAKTLAASVELSNEQVRIARFEMEFADGHTVLTDGLIEPLAAGAPIRVAKVESADMTFEGLMRDLGVTPGTVVAWRLRKTRVTKIGGTLAPLRIDAELAAETTGFEVFDRAFHDPGRKHMVGVRAANVKGRIGVRPDAFEIYDTRADFGKSSLYTRLVSIGFHNDIRVVVDKSSKLDLADISPLVNIPMAGSAQLDVDMAGKSGNPLLTGNLSIQGFEFGGFPIGDLKGAKVTFRPLWLAITDARGKKGKSEFRVPSARLDFDTRASVVVDADVQSERFDLRDFLAIWLFDTDPRWDEVKGEAAVGARVHYVLGGPEDRCGDGNLRVTGQASFKHLDLFEERYDSGKADFDFRWADARASYLGFDLALPSVSLVKGSGTLLGSVRVTPGGVVRGNLVATAVPLSKLDALGALGYALEGEASGVAEVGGTIDALSLSADVRVSPLRVGGARLGGSNLAVRLVPRARARRSLGTTRCGQPIPAPFERAEFERDEPDGVFHVDGRMFGGQVALADLQVTRQRKKHVFGDVDFASLDLGAVAQLAPALAAVDSPPRGRLSGRLHLADLPLDDPARADATFAISTLEVKRGELGARLLPDTRPVRLHESTLEFPALTAAVTTPGGQETVFDVRGRVTSLATAAEVDAKLVMRQVELSTLTAVSPRVERASGSLGGELRVTGPLRSLRYEGGFRLSNGELGLRGLPSAITDIQLGVVLDSGELRITHGTANVGGGTLAVSGSAPLRGFDMGTAHVTLTARGLAFPVDTGVQATVDADLVARWQPPSEGAPRTLPHVSGTVTLRSFEYTRPVTMTADISALAQRGKRTQFESYDPADDSVDFDITLLAPSPMRIENNLVDAELTIDRDGLLLAGTNQRFGLRGTVKLKPGGRLRLRRSEFEIRQGQVRFDDLTRISPQVDVTADTDYRRYTENPGAAGGAAGGGASAATGGATSARGGLWHVTLHAYGDAERLRIDLTSEPQLAQDDIFLLLTVGLTRAELDQAQSASVGESVALEALGTLTGADKAVTDAVPVIDEFRFGSAYSSRTGRTEPTVTIGKRLAERIRASVTSGLSDSREVRSNVEWRLSPRVSVEGSYDNVNDISSSSLGNLGADIRWRLEFE